MPPTKTAPPRTCATCGLLLERKRFGVRLEDFGVFLRRKFCNEPCSNLSKVGRWKSGVTDPKEGRYRARSITTKTSCGECGATEPLDVHHRNADPLDNRPENLAVLCRSCHTKEHYRMGRKRDRTAGRTRNAMGQFA